MSTCLWNSPTVARISGGREAEDSLSARSLIQCLATGRGVSLRIAALSGTTVTSTCRSAVTAPLEAEPPGKVSSLLTLRALRFSSAGSASIPQSVRGSRRSHMESIDSSYLNLERLSKSALKSFLVQTIFLQEIQSPRDGRFARRQRGPLTWPWSAQPRRFLKLFEMECD